MAVIRNVLASIAVLASSVSAVSGRVSNQALRISGGVEAGRNVVSDFQDKLKKGKKIGYMIFVIGKEDGTDMILTEKEGPKGATWDEFVAELTGHGEPRYGVHDLHFEAKDAHALSVRQQEKPIFVFWSPDQEAPIKLKMKYASSKDTLQKALNFDKTFQANGKDDLEFDAATAFAR